MKRYTPYMLFFPLALSTHAYAQKFGTWRIDSVLIAPPYNYLFFSGPWLVGNAKQENEKNWKFYPADDSAYTDHFYNTWLKEKAFVPPGFFFPDCVFFDPGSRFCGSTENKLHGKIQDAASLRFYCDTNFLSTTLDEKFSITQLTPEIYTPYFQPFYFRKTEVSNAEYREFTNWVRDSIVRLGLGFVQKNGMIDWKKEINWSDSLLKKIIYAPLNERYYNHREVDTHKLVYKFSAIPSEYGKPSIEVYPDSLSWTNDFNYQYNEPMTNMYTWHPAYANYPVVGVNYWQCLAFLEWKSKMLSQQMNKKGNHYKIICALPKEREWDFASTAENMNGNVTIMGNEYSQTCDGAWMTDLKLTMDTSKFVRVWNAKVDSLHTAPVWESGRRGFVYSYNDSQVPYRDLLLNDEKTPGDFISDNSFHTAPVNFDRYTAARTLGKKLTKRDLNKIHRGQMKDYPPTERYLAHFDKQTGINFLDGNVSEWMNEDLDSNWRAIFIKHLQLVNGPFYDQYLVQRNIENYYYKQLPKHGKLIRGCNWFDERYAWKYGKNTAGQNAKTFEDPSKDHCTVGFRYVIYVYPL